MQCDWGRVWREREVDDDGGGGGGVGGGGGGGGCELRLLTAEGKKLSNTTVELLHRYMCASIQAQEH